MARPRNHLIQTRIPVSHPALLRTILRIRTKSQSRLRSEEIHARVDHTNPVAELTGIGKQPYCKLYEGLVLLGLEVD